MERLYSASYLKQAMGHKLLDQLGPRTCWRHILWQQRHLKSQKKIMFSILWFATLSIHFCQKKKNNFKTISLILLYKFICQARLLSLDYTFHLFNIHKPRINLWCFIVHTNYFQYQETAYESDFIMPALVIYLQWS